MMLRNLLAACLAVSPAALMAQDNANEVEFRFGIGPSFAPGYFGDEDYEPGVGFKLDLEGLRFGGMDLAGSDVYGFGFGGSLRLVRARNADDFDELGGLDDIDTSLEVGGGLEFNAPDYELFAKLRYGVIGHESLVAEIGGDFLYSPSDRFSFKAGPRVLLGDDTYAQTYFGVSAAEALASVSGYDAFDARGGIMSAGARAEATYAINDNWEVVGIVSYDQLRNDAADSPITQTDDQVRGSILLTRRITFGF